MVLSFSVLIFMVEGLHCRSVIANDSNDENKDFAAQLKAIQEQLRELVLDSEMSHQDREERWFWQLGWLLSSQN